MEAINTGQLIDAVLENMNDDVGKFLEGDCVFISSGMQPPLDDLFRVAIEELNTTKGKKKHLIVILETTGGYIETVERLVSVMRKHYLRVSFIVPSHAYSAGTVLVLSGDEIYMDYYSILGPIDPQYQDENGHSLLPGAGYLAKFEELIETINTKQGDPTAELAYLIKKFDPAKLFHIEQAMKHSQSLIEEWLPKYKFKSWKETETRKEKVTPALRKKRAKDIACILGDADRWHSHGKGISMNELTGAEIKLVIEDFGKIDELSSFVRNYHGLAIDYAQKISAQRFIHTKNGMRRLP